MLEQVLAAMRGGLGLDPGPPAALTVPSPNRHYRLEFEGRPHHLVVYERPDAAALARRSFAHKILRHLQQSHFDLSPRQVIVNRESLFSFDAGRFALGEWVEGCRRPDDPPLTDRQVESLAAGLAHLHRYLATLELSRSYAPDQVAAIPLPHLLLQCEAQVGRLQQRLAAGDGDFGEGAAQGWTAVRWRVEALARDFPLELYWQVRQQDPTGVVQGAWRPTDTAFTDERLTHVLDFSRSFNEIRLWDVAVAALSLAGPLEGLGELTDLQRPARFLAAYQRHGRLTREERRLLPALLGFVPVKAVLGATTTVEITGRVRLVGELLDGGAVAIVARAGLEA